MGMSLFIVWRESVEALLVVGILYAWLQHQPDRTRNLGFLWGGVAAGLGLAVLMALLFMFAGEWFSGSSGEWFQAGMMLLACILIVQMIGWMHRHGRTMKQSLEKDAQQALQGGSIGLLLLSMIAVGREGSETVVFLYGSFVQRHGAELAWFIGGGVIGFLLALLTFGILQLGNRFLSWRLFFKISEIVLLLLAAAMLMNGFDRINGQLMGMELPDALYGWLGEAIWDTSGLLNDGSRTGSLVANLTGYRAMPSLVAVILYALYWIVALSWIYLPRKPRRPRPNANTPDEALQEAPRHTP